MYLLDFCGEIDTRCPPVPRSALAKGNEGSKLRDHVSDRVMLAGKGRDINMEEAAKTRRGEGNPYPIPAWDSQSSRVDRWSLRVGK